MTTGDDGVEAPHKDITFSQLMRPMKERREKVMIVFGDTVRHIEKWNRKGMPRRLVAEGLIEAAITHIYEEACPREWLSFCRYMISEAERHKTDVLEGLPPLPDADTPS